MNITDVLDNARNIDDILDNLIEPIKDYTDTAGDIIGPIKGVLTIYNLRKKMQLKSFIKGYSGTFKNHQITEEDKLQLKNFFSKEKNILYISEIIESAVSSLSIKSSSILGIIAGKILSEKPDSLDDTSYILITSLRNLTDKDLELFNQLYTFLKIKKPPFRELGDGRVEYRMRDIFKDMEAENIPFDRIAVEFVIEKLKNYGILSYGPGGIGSYGNDRGAFMLTDYSEALFHFLKSI